MLLILLYLIKLRITFDRIQETETEEEKEIQNLAEKMNEWCSALRTEVMVCLLTFFIWFYLSFNRIIYLI